MDNEKIKSLYAEFMGYLDQAPSVKDRPGIYNEQMWEQYNKSVTRLSEISGEDYSDFLIKVDRGQTGDYVETMVYRSKLGGLISRLRADFNFLPAQSNYKPRTMPNIVIKQTQQQSQQILFQMILDVQSKIDEKLPTLLDGSKEETFFQKLKGSLSATTGIIDLMGKMFKLAKECGIQTEQLQKLFS